MLSHFLPSTNGIVWDWMAGVVKEHRLDGVVSELEVGASVAVCVVISSVYSLRLVVHKN